MAAGLFLPRCVDSDRRALNSPKYCRDRCGQRVLPLVRRGTNACPMLTCGLLRSNLPFAIFGFSNSHFSRSGQITVSVSGAGPASCDADFAIRQIIAYFAVNLLGDGSTEQPRNDSKLSSSTAPALRQERSVFTLFEHGWPEAHGQQ